MELCNENLTDMVTPVNAKALQRMLIETGFDEKKTNYLVQGFTKVFDLGYEGPAKCTDTSQNIPLCVGTKLDIWEKVMKEVAAG